jgi:predicted MPP superfamily phosphohydrolase
MDIGLVLIGLFGHIALWVAFYNWFHSSSWSVRWGDAATFLAAAIVLIVPILAWWYRGSGVLDHRFRFLVPWPLAAYLVLCWMTALWTVVAWIRRHILHRPPQVLRHHRVRLLDLAEIVTGPTVENDQRNLLLRLPGNETFSLDVAERGIDVPGLHRNLDCLSIVHFSDLHISGKVPEEYFLEVVRLSNALEPDLVAITGDLVDTNKAVDSVSHVLSGLAAPYRAYFVLGNHDAKVDHVRLRDSLVDCGLVDLGGRWLEVSIRGHPIILAGCERPWFRATPDMSTAPSGGSEGPLRLLLSHTPDQLEWARSHHFDLMLAGHLHGGQIRLPLVGPVFSPSRAGAKYSCGLFHAPPTILHVTRGVSGEYPFRMNCPPEIVRLVLRPLSN